MNVQSDESSDHNTGDHNTGPPLVVDIDGTLLRTDLLLETFWQALGQNLMATLIVVVSSLLSPARLKHRLRQISEPDIELLPVRQSVLDIIDAALKQGRSVHLASGADQSQVDAVAKRFNLPGPHFGSSGACNLTGTTKAQALIARFGDTQFDYAGNAWVDLKIWSHAREIIAIAPGPRLIKRLKQLGKPVSIVQEARDPSAFLLEMRPHQWIKNLLLFLPLIAVHNFDFAGIAQVILAVAAFSLGASALYIVNDLLDLDADRRHPEKCDRPIASGRLPIRHAMSLCTGLIITASLLAWAVSPTVAAFTGIYMLSSLVYSLWLKRLIWIDLLMLAWMFLLRAVTGAVASQSEVSIWLLAFVFVVILSLAAVKRITALARTQHSGHLHGRGYCDKHRPALYMISVLGAGLALLIFLGYAFRPGAANLYTAPAILGLAVLPLAMWFARIIRLSAQGKGDYDPSVFVIHDRFGLALIASVVALALLAV